MDRPTSHTSQKTYGIVFTFRMLFEHQHCDNNYYLVNVFFVIAFYNNNQIALFLFAFTYVHARDTQE